VELVVDFQFKSHLLDHVANTMFHEAATRMMGAFESRASGPSDDATAQASFFLTGANRRVLRRGVTKKPVVEIRVTMTVHYLV